MASKRVLVLFEPGRGGAAALDLARELAEAEDATVTVLSVVPRAPSGSRCGNSALEYNLIVREAVEKDLNEARERLAVLGERAAYELLMEGVDPPLAQFTAARARLSVSGGPSGSASQPRRWRRLRRAGAAAGS